MLHVGLDLCRSRVDVCVVDDTGEVVEVTRAAPDPGGLDDLVARIARHDQPVAAAIESMNGARFVHDHLERRGWSVEIADAQKVKGIAPLACKTDRIDAGVLAALSQRDLVPAIWLPTPRVRGERERARFRLHLVKHRTALKNRIHSTLIAFQIPCPVSDLFGVAGRQLLERLDVPDPWRDHVTATLAVIDHLDAQIHECGLALRHAGATHPYVPLLKTAPGIGPILGYTIAAELGDITRFPTPKQFVGYTGLCPRVYQSGDTDWRGSLTKHGPRYLRWALIEAATRAWRHDPYRQRALAMRKRLGTQRGAKIVHIDIARRLATAIWWMLTKQEPFAPADPTAPMVA